jgi:hypothetical protein
MQKTVGVEIRKNALVADKTDERKIMHVHSIEKHKALSPLRFRLCDIAAAMPRPRFRVWPKTDSINEKP